MRWPGLAHLTTASVVRLPRGSRLRRTLLERAAHAAYEAWNRDDLKLARAAADPEIEVHFAQGVDSPVGLDDVYHGPDGYCRAMEEWSAAWRSWRVEVEDVVEVAPDKVIITGYHIGEGLASGAEIEQWGAVLYTFRRGKILRVDAFLFSDKDRVSEAVRVDCRRRPRRRSRRERASSRPPMRAQRRVAGQSDPRPCSTLTRDSAPWEPCG